MRMGETFQIPGTGSLFKAGQGPQLLKTLYEDTSVGKGGRFGQLETITTASGPGRVSVNHVAG